MNMKYKILFVLVFVLSFADLYSCGAQKTDSLKVVTIINKKLPPILNSITIHEKKCEYYSDSLVFYVFINDRNDLYSEIQIGSIGNNVIRSGKELGCFLYKDHLFIIEGVIEKSLFSFQNEFVKIDFQEINNKDGVIEKGIINIDVYEDDSFSYWNYYYQNGNFIFESKHTFCR